VDHAVARHRRIVAFAHDLSDGARRARASGEHRHEAVARDATRRDRSHHRSHLPRPSVHALILIQASRELASRGLMAIPAPDILEATQDAGLRYSTDERRGIARVRAGAGFRYEDPDGTRIRDGAELRRIKRLAIPPAWTNVWICPDPRGHLQATGRDAKGRKQYRYHERFRAVRDEDKYARMVDFARVLPKIRARVNEDLSSPKLTREKVLATIVTLLEQTLIRVGNEEYARENRHFGLTTLRGRHVAVRGSRIRFRFTGKSGASHDVDLRDARVARIVRRLQELPGQELFQYVDEGGETRRIGSDDVNAYLREIAGDDFTAKDFRTWAGTVLAAQALAGCEPVENVRYARRNVTAAIAHVAARLGNTPAVCRKAYVHPAVVEAYMDGSLSRALRRRGTRTQGGDLRREEAHLLRFLEARLAKVPQAA
jgi:DNA topoisomerase-1